PNDQFVFWTHPLAARPISQAPNARELLVRPGPNSPLTVWWPEHFANLDGVDVFHGPHNLLPRRLPCASVVTIHDLMALEEPALHLQGMERLIKRAYYPQAIRRALREATRLIAPSRATADRIAALHPPAARRTHVIWEAVEPIFRPSDNRDAARKLLGADWPYLLVVGANVPSKQHALAVAAFSAAVPAPWRLVLLQRRRKSHFDASERIIFLDAVKREDVIALLQGAGALLQPSLYEGFGLPVLEAMACGCPVVASDIAPFREITEGAAILTPPGDVAKFAAALREVIGSGELRASLRVRGLAQAQKFSWDRCARETLEVYREGAIAR
ncbi:MAG: glycosyltransferase family 4 protein, partial [Verrucomicrobiota bacterium]|nr:glycosyltransferase family 4 protein [Verrucomicrobiota bacterium]